MFITQTQEYDMRRTIFRNCEVSSIITSDSVRDVTTARRKISTKNASAFTKISSYGTRYFLNMRTSKFRFVAQKRQKQLLIKKLRWEFLSLNVLINMVLITDIQIYIQIKSSAQMQPMTASQIIDLERIKKKADIWGPIFVLLNKLSNRGMQLKLGIIHHRRLLINTNMRNEEQLLQGLKIQAYRRNFIAGGSVIAVYN